MEPIYLDELVAASNYSTTANLSADHNDSNKMKVIIDGFLAHSGGKLQGEAWNQVQSKLSKYSSAFNKHMTIATNLSNAIQKALALLIEYIGDYPSLDYSQLPVIEASYEACKKDIASINAALAAKIPIERVDANGNTKFMQVYKVTGEERINLIRNVNEIKKSMEEIKLLIDKLNGLEAVYNEAKGILDTAFEEVKEFGITVSSITPSETVHYVSV